MEGENSTIFSNVSFIFYEWFLKFFSSHKIYCFQFFNFHNQITSHSVIALIIQDDWHAKILKFVWKFDTKINEFKKEVNRNQRELERNSCSNGRWLLPSLCLRVKLHTRRINSFFPSCTIHYYWKCCDFIDIS